jgi:hypothetical protein
VEAELLDPVKELLDPLMVNQFFPATKEAFDMVIHKNRVSLSIWRANQEQHTTSDGDKHKFIKLTAKLPRGRLHALGAGQHGLAGRDIRSRRQRPSAARLSEEQGRSGLRHPRPQDAGGRPPICPSWNTDQGV